MTTTKNPYLKVCGFCQKDFLGRRNSKYCSPTCRDAWWIRNINEEKRLKRTEYHKKWSNENWQSKRNYHLRYFFGLTHDQYEELLAKQDYKCAVCKRPEKDFIRKLAVDHDHSTNEIFGLLCSTCNHTLIGKYRSPKIFEAAAKYLEKGTGLFIPKRMKKKRKIRKRR